MSTYQIILLVVASFYVAEVLIAVPPTAVFFRSTFGRRYRARLAFDGGIRIRESFILALSTWFPWGRVFVTEIDALRLRHDAFALGPGWSPPPCPPVEEPHWLPWENGRHARQDGLRVAVGQHGHLRAASVAAARTYAAELRDLSMLSPTERESRLQQDATARFDIAAIRETVKGFERTSWQLRLLSTLLLAYVCGVLPLLSVTGSPVAWPRLALVYVALLASIQLAFMQAHRALYPAARGARWKRILSMLISPAEAMAAPQALSRDLLAGRDPLAVAAALLGTEDSHPMAGRWRRGIYFGGHLDAAERDTYTSLLRHLGTSPTTEGAPTREEPCLSYCPRCHEQLRVESGPCPACPTVALVPFSD